jgi:glutamine---fructose-6-phosphate transaminase (isomerizing)
LVIGIEADIRAQGDLLQAILTIDRQDELLLAAAALASPGCPVVFTGMGSSLAAARLAAQRIAASGRWTTVVEAGELFHYGLEGWPAGSLFVLVSQSGRSAEVVALAERLRSIGGIRLITVVNDLSSRLASLGDVVVPLRAGMETTVSTKTFLATLVVLQELADALTGDPGRTAGLILGAELPQLVRRLASGPEIADEAALGFSSVDALVVVGRGPAFAAADYAALILKETCALPAEAMPAGSFRHGPIEITGPAAGMIVLAPEGRTQTLSIRLAADTARLGSPTWLLTTSGDVPSSRGVGSDTRGLVVSELPSIPEMLAALLYAVPLQRLAVTLAELRGRQPGVLERSAKVTTME